MMEVILLLVIGIIFGLSVAAFIVLHLFGRMLERFMRRWWG